MKYHLKKFSPIANSENAETSEDTIFEYIQEGNIIHSTYSSKNILKGHLIGLVDQEGTIKMSYHQINTKGELMTGICVSTPLILANGKIRLQEEWQWTSGDRSKGTSILEEI